MAFFVGQKVVTTAVWYERDYEAPQQGVVYTIRDIIEGTSDDGVGTGLRLVEIVNRKRWCSLPSGGNGMKEYAFAAEYFRPVTDISDLQSIVTEVMNGKPRKIEDDQFDAPRKKVRAR